MEHGRRHAIRRRTPVALALVLGALVLLLAGCAHTSSQAQVIVQTPVPTATPTSTPTPTPTPFATPDPNAPTTGKWIDVNLTTFMVRLMDGRTVVQQIGPVAVGAQIDTGAYESTQTGMFHVYNKIAPLSYDAPYKTYIQWWVGFDPQKANGLHSFLLDAHGNVVDHSTGRVSNGCIRTPDPKAIFDFATVGMPVYVHL